MDINEGAIWAIGALMIGALLLLPKWFSFRQRAYAGVVSSVVGWTGAVLGVELGDQPFLQSEMTALVWVGLSGFAIGLGIILLVPVAFESWRKVRGSKAKKERWRAGHWKG